LLLITTDVYALAGIIMRDIMDMLLQIVERFMILSFSSDRRKITAFGTNCKRLFP